MKPIGKMETKLLGALPQSSVSALYYRPVMAVMVVLLSNTVRIIIVNDVF